QRKGEMEKAAKAASSGPLESEGRTSCHPHLGHRGIAAAAARAAPIVALEGWAEFTWGILDNGNPHSVWQRVNGSSLASARDAVESALFTDLFVNAPTLL